MSGAALIAGDWGLSHLRLFLCDAAGAVLDRRRGPGVADAGGDLPGCLRDHLTGWDAVPVVLCGMVGSTLGWTDTPYVMAPASAADIARALMAVAFDGRMVLIVPGMHAQSVSGAPEVMRGEETQIIGALQLRPEFGEGRRLFCLPGTHTKWVEVSDGVIRSIATSVTGELYGLLCRGSSLSENSAPWDGAANEAFRRGLSRSDGPLLRTLFEARARRLTGDLQQDEARAFLSGVIIGSDVLHRPAAADPVVVVGETDLNGLYGEALRQRKVQAVCLDGEMCSVHGLTALYGAAAPETSAP